MKIALIITFLAIFGRIPLAAAPRWEDPSVNRVGTLPARDELIPFVSEAEAVRWADLELSREASPYVMSLNGTWSFDWKKRPDVDWEVSDETIVVPGCWQLATRKDGGRYDPPIYTNYNYPHVNNPPHILEDPPTNFTQFVYRNPVGRYRRTFIVPSAWKDRRVILHFNGVASAMEVRVNGREVGYSEDSRLPSEFDLSEDVIPGGSNTLEVTVYRWCDGSYLEDQDFWRLSGIYRDVWLQAEGRETPHDVRAIPDNACVRHPGESEWSPEMPNLYTRTYRAPNGDWYAWKVGHRTIAITNGLVTVNGKRLVVKGVNRHEMSPTGGYTVTHEEMLSDVQLIKAYGFNAVRTCHYPNDTYWYRLCDKYGLLLVCEANVECHGSGQGNKFRSCARRPEWCDSFVERGVNMVKTFRTHPSIYFWSLGNECWEGANLQAEYEAMKALDSTRPIQYSTDSPVAYSDILAPMYWTVARCENYVTHVPPKPLIQCEYEHTMGNAGGTLAAHAASVGRNASYQGGFIWDFADQALVGKDGHLKYGGDFGDIPNNGNFNCNGLFDTFRRPHGSAYEARAVNERESTASPLSFRPNFWRAPTDNDRGWKMPRVCRVWREATRTGKLPVGCTNDLKVVDLPDGSRRVDWTFFAPAELPELPRVGLTFTIPGGTNSIVRWHGRGPWENYSDRIAATPIGDYALTVGELNPNNYVIPGEQGYRTETTRLEIGGLVIETRGEPFGFNVWPWTQNDLDQAQHIEELAVRDFLTVNIDAAQMGVGGDDSWSEAAKPRPECRLATGRAYKLTLRFLPPLRDGDFGDSVLD